MLWITFALLAALAWAIVGILDKYVITHELKDPILATVMFGGASFIIFAIISLIFGNIVLPSKTIITAIVAGALYNTGVWFYYTAISKEEVSRVIPLLSLIPIFVLILAFLLLSERFTFLKYVGVCLIVIGAILISFKHKEHHLKLTSALLIVVCATIFFAFRDIFVKFTVLQANMWSLLFWIGVGTGFVSLFLFAMHHPHIRKKAREGEKHIFLVDCLAVGAFFL